MAQLRFSFGCAGVSPYENAKAKKWGRRFDWPMAVLALGIPFLFYFEYLNLLPRHFSIVANWVVWLVFALETLLVSALVWDKKRYLRQNWMNLLIITLGFPLLWQSALLAGSLRGMRLIVLFGVLFRLTGISRKVLSRNSLRTTLLVSAVVIVLSGILISMLDPGINSAAEGIWWAWVTVTTVGYGDLVPVSTVGRIFGGLLILLGVGLFALLTANFSAVLIGREVSGVEKEVESEESEILRRLERIEQRLTEIESRLRRD